MRHIEVSKQASEVDGPLARSMVADDSIKDARPPRVRAMFNHPRMDLNEWFGACIQADCLGAVVFLEPTSQLPVKEADEVVGPIGSYTEPLGKLGGRSFD
jgi:hypothetical protein